MGGRPMLVICVNAGTLSRVKSTGYVNGEEDLCVLIEEGAWDAEAHPTAHVGQYDSACCSTSMSGTPVDDRQIVDWILQQETTIVV